MDDPSPRGQICSLTQPASLFSFPGRRLALRSKRRQNGSLPSQPHPPPDQRIRGVGIGARFVVWAANGRKLNSTHAQGMGVRCGLRPPWACFKPLYLRVAGSRSLAWGEIFACPRGNQHRSSEGDYLRLRVATSIIFCRLCIHAHTDTDASTRNPRPHHPQEENVRVFPPPMLCTASNERQTSSRHAKKRSVCSLYVMTMNRAPMSFCQGSQAMAAPMTKLKRKTAMATLQH